MRKTLKIALAVALVFVCGFAVTKTVVSPNVECAYAVVYQQGSRGNTVSTIQKKLKNWGYYTGAVDGIFGAKTKEAVKYFQRKNGLTVDGIVGNKTLKALGMSASSSSGSSSFLLVLNDSTCSPIFSISLEILFF